MDDPPEGPDEGWDDDRPERKDRVLHTRIPDSLERHIKRRARSLGMSVSTVVRNVLLTTFGLVEDIVNDSTEIALAATGHDPRARGPRDGRRTSGASEGEIVAWQEAVLNRNAVCDRCNAILSKGTRAAVGIPDSPGSRSIVCLACLTGLADGATAAPEPRR